MAPLSPADLILNPDGSVYHLALHPHEVAPYILLTGDPGRLAGIQARMDEVSCTRQHREFGTVTGRIGDLRLTVISTGIGTDNIDIVLNELDALVNVDLTTRTQHPHLTRLRILRLGTCGSLDPQFPVDGLIFTRYALGLDGLMGFYARAQEAIDDAVAAFNQGFEPPLTAYGTSCSAELARLTAGYISLKNGITVTASGFYGPQGRNLGRIAPAYPDLLHRLTSFRWDGYAVANLEMETAGILALSRALGHEAGSLSVALANRREGTFSQDVPAAVTHLIDTGLALMADWARTAQ